MVSVGTALLGCFQVSVPQKFLIPVANGSVLAQSFLVTVQSWTVSCSVALKSLKGAHLL